ncbi:hypothetical protein M9H77_08040 [Catharanthus roseus]|uniref:Uncharacterized protein n=1 Tax=Catharanthus roseus TaxID=4058 RepID=A0ACC0BWN4_CATRO|nr:hypothetical protein M9H77_08040 [Catharanthus roseus]
MQTHQGYSFMSNAIVKVIEECNKKNEGFDDEGQASKSNLDVKKTKCCEALDLPLTEGPAPIARGRFLDGLASEGNTLPRPVGFLKKRMENKDSILNLRRAVGGDSSSYANSCTSYNERKRKAAARRPQFEAANLRSNNKKLFRRKGRDLLQKFGSFFAFNDELIFFLES